MHVFNNNLQKYKTVLKEMCKYRNILLEYDIIINFVLFKIHYIIPHTRESQLY